MKLTGVISDLTTSADRSTFSLRSSDGHDIRVQTAAPLPKGLTSGERVEVTGEMPPDPPFVATSVVRAQAPVPPSHLPWKWIAAAAALCAILLVVFLSVHSTGRSGGGSDQGGGGSPTPQPTPAPPSLTPPSGNVKIMNAHSELCLSPAGGTQNLNDPIG